MYTLKKLKSNISYTAALRKMVRKYFPESIGQKRANNFIKAVQRLNDAKKHAAYINYVSEV